MRHRRFIKVSEASANKRRIMVKMRKHLDKVINLLLGANRILTYCAVIAGQDDPNLVKVKGQSSLPI